ncbi:tRNA (5-methylaminomethyl-2-thiouridine)(34)-methyltransferase MnmD [Caulobacter sp. SLTY]|uniref:tRNA (5-methylaminomethyl-2-thiouridine)(34)-methyltransferase MnmD n=1 Tax=Caulobacter sp. SLTY TaxID=2683262 RepID=UPI001F0DB15A|nr:tRNA (5-methylaminomethyl-2-thiouridine)(34)-methyltransferase MnmD [Caulobacter sp. SLTY]
MSLNTLMAADPPSPVQWRDDGLPGSTLYGDVYFSSEDGLAESRAVFLAGCGLPHAWERRRYFTVGELGFGTGLNIAALLTLWIQTRPPGGRLHIFSLEAHPMDREDAARALAHWPEIAEAANALLSAWPGRAKGFHRLSLPAFDAVLDLAVADAAEALAQWGGRADAWFLDGFAPAANPAMWTDKVLALIAARSAPGARAATFTVAGAVRRGLAAAGFAVSKQPGFGRKRERLEAVLPGEPSDPTHAGPVVILGAGIAGASVARALAALGVETRILDTDGPAAGASGNPAALMSPRLEAGDTPPARLHAQAFRRARRLYGEVPGAVLSTGARQLAETPRDPGRFARIAQNGLFEPGEMTAEADALSMTTAQVIAPAQVIAAWAGAVEATALDALRANARALVVCTGPAAAELTGAPVRPVRGQCTLALGASLDQAVSFGGYAVPTPEGVVFGATHQPGETDTALRPEDDEANLAAMRASLPGLADEIAGRPTRSRASIRAGAPDYLPVAGPVEGQPGVFVLTGLGGRGFCLAPLLGEHVAALIAGVPSPLPAPLAAAVDPARFARRAARRTSQKPAR